MSQQKQDKLINHPAAKLEIGHRMVCPECSTELIVKADNYQGTVKNRWANITGEWHIRSIDNQYVHTKTNRNPTGLGVGEVFEEATEDEKKMHSQELLTDDIYHRLAVSQVKKRGGDMKGNIVAYEKEMLLRIKQNRLLDELIDAAQGKNNDIN